MKKWIETRHVKLVFGRVIDGGQWNTIFQEGPHSLVVARDEAALDATIADLEKFANACQYRVTGVAPLTETLWCWKSRSTTVGGGYGYGLSAPQVTGFVVFLEKEEEIADDEYQRRCGELKHKQRALELEELLIPQLRTTIASLEETLEASNQEPAELVEKKELFCRPMWFIGKQKFINREEAEKHLSAIRGQQSYIASKLAAQQKELAAYEDELRKLKTNQSA